MLKLKKKTDDIPASVSMSYMCCGDIGKVVGGPHDGSIVYSLGGIVVTLGGLNGTAPREMYWSNPNSESATKVILFPKGTELTFITGEKP